VEDRDQQQGSDRTATVRGMGVARVRPDGVVVGLTVQHRAEGPAEALNEAARKAQLLEALFRDLGVLPREVVDTDRAAELT
jgi:uncharacterized protein YggE